MKTNSIYYLFMVAIVTVIVSCSNKNNSSEQQNVQMETWAGDANCATTFIDMADKNDESSWNESSNQKIEKEKMISTILDAVKTSKQKAYNVSLDQNSEMTLPAVKGLLDGADTLMVEDINNPGKFKMVIQPTTIKASDIKRVVFKEKWYFDPEKFRMEKKVMAICLLKNARNEMGEIIGDYPLFWVKLSEK